MAQSLELKIIEIERIQHKHGNKLDIHEKQLYLGDKRVDMLDKHREDHALEIAAIKGQQDHAAEAMESLSASLDKLTDKISELFTIKNMVIGAFVSVSFVVCIFVYVLKMFLDYYR